MNARQKAKRYKKLYENMLKAPYPVAYQTRDGKHYKVRYKVTRIEMADAPPNALQNSIENHMLKELRPIIWDNLKVEYDEYSNEFIHSLDIWI